MAVHLHDHIDFVVRLRIRDARAEARIDLQEPVQRCSRWTGCDKWVRALVSPVQSGEDRHVDLTTGSTAGHRDGWPATTSVHQCSSSTRFGCARFNRIGLGQFPMAPQQGAQPRQHRRRPRPPHITATHIASSQIRLHRPQYVVTADVVMPERGGDVTEHQRE